MRAYSYAVPIAKLMYRYRRLMRTLLFTFVHRPPLYHPIRAWEDGSLYKDIIGSVVYMDSPIIRLRNIQQQRQQLDIKDHSSCYW